MKVLYVDVSVSSADPRKLKKEVVDKHTPGGMLRGYTFSQYGLVDVANVELRFLNITHPLYGLWHARKFVKKVSLPGGTTTAEYRIYHERL